VRRVQSNADRSSRNSKRRRGDLLIGWSQPAEPFPSTCSTGSRRGPRASVARAASRADRSRSSPARQGGSQVTSGRQVQRPQKAAHGILPAVPEFSPRVRWLAARARFRLPGHITPMRRLRRRDPGVGISPAPAGNLDRLGLGRRSFQRHRLRRRHDLGLRTDIGQLQPV